MNQSSILEKHINEHLKRKTHFDYICLTIQVLDAAVKTCLTKLFLVIIAETLVKTHTKLQSQQFSAHTHNQKTTLLFITLHIKKWKKRSVNVVGSV